MFFLVDVFFFFRRVCNQHKTVCRWNFKAFLNVWQQQKFLSFQCALQFSLCKSHFEFDKWGKHLVQVGNCWVTIGFDFSTQTRGGKTLLFNLTVNWVLHESAMPLMTMTPETQTREIFHELSTWTFSYFPLCLPALKSYK